MISFQPFRCLASVRSAVPAKRLISSVRIVEVSPRDGLQNEKQIISTETKLSLIDRLEKAGLTTIEATSFVSPKWVPQMADAKQIYTELLKKNTGVCYPVLTPNLKGLLTAMECASAVSGAKVEEIAVFGAASEGFSMKNINKTIDEAFNAFRETVGLALSNNIRVRAYLSTVIGCPYDGRTEPKRVARLVEKYFEMGCYEVSLGDTIGVGTPRDIENMLREVLQVAGPERIAIHAHDTYGQAVANVVKAVEMGVSVVDSSVASLGGCPYAKGATGNVATEDIVYALHGLGYTTGVDLNKLVQVGEWISAELGRPYQSRAGRAIAAKL